MARVAIGSSAEADPPGPAAQPRWYVNRRSRRPRASDRNTLSELAHRGRGWAAWPGARRHNGGVTEPEITIRSVCEGDRPMLAWLVTELWGSEVVAVRGTSLRPAEMAGFIAEQSGRLAGLLTYQLLGGDTLEIVTLNALDRRRGIGTMLIDAAAAKARRFGCREIRLTTTNDNVDALRFYQRRGFRLAELRPGAVDQARRQKPEIPLVGDYGIPLRDEIDLTLPV
jgi:GNAT superfamily N-acetyltransferase